MNCQTAAVWSYVAIFWGWVKMSQHILVTLLCFLVFPIVSWVLLWYGNGDITDRTNYGENLHVTNQWSSQRNLEQSDLQLLEMSSADSRLHDENKMLASFSFQREMYQLSYENWLGETSHFFYYCYSLIWVIWLLTAASPLHLIVLLLCLSQGSIPCLASAHFCINSSVRELTAQIREFPGTKALISTGNWNDPWKNCPNQMDSQATEPLTHPSPFPLPFHQPSLPHSEPGISEKRLCLAQPVWQQEGEGAGDTEEEEAVHRVGKYCTPSSDTASKPGGEGTYCLQEHLLSAVPWHLQQVLGV